MTTDNFARAAAFTMAHEGGARVSDNPADPGGLTKYGISQRAYPQLDIRGLTEAAALELYRRDYWDKVQGDALPWPVALAVFDYAFNAGVNRAAIDLQCAVAVKIDGNIGPLTLKAVERLDPIKTASEVNARRLTFLGGLGTWSNFGLGWSRRVLAVQTEVAQP